MKNMSANWFIKLLIAISIMCSAVPTFADYTPEQIVDGWRGWIAENEGHEWRYERIVNGIKYDRVAIADSGLVLMESNAMTKGKESSAFIQNTAYFASLEKLPEGQWFLKTLVLAGTERFQAASESPQDWKTSLFISRYYLEFPEDDEFEASVDWENKQLKCVRKVDDSKDPRPKEVVYSLIGQTPFLPFRIQSVREGFGQRIELIATTDWDCSHGYCLPKSYELRSKLTGFPEGNGESTVEKWNSVKVSERPQDPSRFRLSFYGIPEPEELDTPKWWLWIVAGASVAVVGAFLIRNARQ